MRWLGVQQKVWMDSALFYASKAVTLDPTSPDGYLVRGYVHRFLNKVSESRADFRNAFQIAPNDPAVLSSYGSLQLREKDERGADLILKSIGNQYSFKDPEYFLSMNEVYHFIGDRVKQVKVLRKAKSLDPGSVAPLFSLAHFYWWTGEYDKGIRELEEAEKINPKHQAVIDALGWLNHLANHLEKAVAYWSRYPEIEATFEDTTQTVPFRSRLGMTYLKMGRKKEADALVAEDLKIRSDLLAGKRGLGAWWGLQNVYYDLSVDNAYFGNNDKAVEYMDSAFHYNINFDWGLHNDPLLAGIRNRNDYKDLMKKVDDLAEFKKRAFSNAVNRMGASKELRDILK